LTDVVTISGDVATRTVAPPPSVKIEMPAPVAPVEQLPDRSEENVVLRRIEGEPIHLDESGDALRKEIRSRKEPGPPGHSRS